MTERKLSNWLSSYLEFTAEQESPLLFHKWTAMAMISAAIGRNAKIDRSYYTIYPNIFVILVAGSAKCRKSVSTVIGINILRGIENPPMIFSQKITNEALIHALSECRKDNEGFGLIYASELSVFMGSEAVKTGLIPTLTDLYDSPENWSYRTRGRGVENLDNTTITILAASTKDWIQTSIPESAIGGGFTSRIVFVFQDMPRKSILFPIRPVGDLKSNLVHDLNIISKLKGEFKFTPGAVAFATDWYDKELFKTHDAKMDGYFGRKHDTMFKVSALLSLAESNSLMIEERHVREALNMLNEVEVHLGSVLESVSASSAGTNMEKVLSIIKRSGEAIKHSDLLRKCWRLGTADELSTYIRTLLESGEIEEFMDSRNKARFYRPRSND